MKKLALSVFQVVCLALLAAAPARAAVGGLFSEGQLHVLVEAGSGTAYNNNYFILGAGVTYYVVDGLGVGLTYDNWSGASPAINQITPSVQYVFFREATVKPYLGAFYRHTSVSGQQGFNSVGARAGIYLHAGGHTALGLGAVAESYMNCQQAFGACHQVYPEISLVFAF